MARLGDEWRQDTEEHLVDLPACTKDTTNALTLQIPTGSVMKERVFKSELTPPQPVSPLAEAELHAEPKNITKHILSAKKHKRSGSMATRHTAVQELTETPSVAKRCNSSELVPLSLDQSIIITPPEPTGTKNQATNEKKKSASRLIRLMGSSETGKTRLISLIQLICTPPSDGPKKPRKKQNKKSSPRGKSKKLPNLQFEELQTEETTLGPSPDAYLVLFDVSRPKTLSQAEEIIKKLRTQANKDQTSPVIVLVANKLDLLADKKYPIDQSLLYGKSISLTYQCKYVALSLRAIEDTESSQSVDVPIDTRHTLYGLIYLISSTEKIVNWKYSSNQMENVTTVFDDYWPVSQESTLLVSFTPSEHDGTPYYGIIKGEFIFLISLENPEVLRIFYLPVCSLSFESTRRRVSILNITIPDGSIIEIKSQSLKHSLHQWESSIKTRNRIFPSEATSGGSRTSVNITESLSRYINRLEKELTTISVHLAVSYLYNLCARSRCVDCGHYSCFNISRFYAILICSECIKIHLALSGKQIIKSFEFHQAKQFKTFWSILGPRSNDYFNILWEGKITAAHKITEQATAEERDHFIGKKYSERLFYTAPTDVLYVKTTEGISNRWEPRYLWITPEGELKIYEDAAYAKLIDSFHVSWCSFRSGVDLDLDPRYLHLIGPKSSDLFRTVSPEAARCWTVILESSQLRVKKQPENVNFPRCPLRSSVACMEPSSITIANIRDLLLEKSHLVGIRKLKSQRLQVRQKLMQQLQEINFELEGLEASEEKSLAKIEDLEPVVTVRDLQELQAIVGHVQTTDEVKELRNSAGHVNANTAGLMRCTDVITPRFSQPSTIKKSGIMKTVAEIIQATENGTSEFDADTGYIKAGTVNRLLAALVDPFYSETEYTEIFLQTFPYVLQPIQFLKELAKRFASAHIRKKKETKMNRNPQTKHITMSITAAVDYSNEDDSDLGMSRTEASVGQTRMTLLNIMEIWMSNYWPGDFSRNPELIVFMISFLDYIVQPMHGFRHKADCLRNLLQEQYRQYNTVTIPVSRRVRAVSTSGQSLGQFILDVEPLEIAKHLCLHNHELYCKVQPRELLDKAWTRSDRLETAPNVVELTELFNRITAWASTCIILQTKLKTRVKILDRFIHIAIHCKELNNFHSLVALVGALRDPGVGRCRKTWRALPVKVQNSFEDLVNLISIQGNWMAYREILTNAGEKGLPCVPYIGVFLKDLVFIEDGVACYVSEAEKIVNFEKNRKIAKVIRRVCRFQDIPYAFIPLASVSATLDLTLNVYPLLNEQERYDSSLEIEPKKEQKKK